MTGDAGEHAATSAGRWRVRGPEFRLLVTLLVLAAAVNVFAEIADDVTEGETKAFDRTVLLALREPGDRTDPLGPLWLEEAGRDITALGGIPVLTLVTLAVLGFLVLDGKGRMALFVTVCVGGGVLLSNVLKGIFERSRPDLVPHGVEVYTASFPSGHSLMSAVVFITLAALLARSFTRRAVKVYVLAIGVLLALLVGVSRVYLGVHWPTDVLAGWTAGLAWALLCWEGARWLQRAGRLERAHENRR